MTKIFFLAALACAGLQSFAGISTNGSHLTVDQNNVWYLGEAPVPYCIERDASFPFSPEETEVLVKESIETWVQFFQKHELDKLSFTHLKDGKSLKLALNFEYQGRCSLTEEHPELLRFYLGTKAPEKKGLVIDSGHGALALAIREDYNHDTYRNGGAIWIKNWGMTKLQTKHFLLHELGHVFGMEHDSVYVMDSKLADNVVVKSKSIFYGQIESPTWIYRLSDGDVVDFTANGRSEGKYEPNFLLLLFKDLFGFGSGAHHSVRLHFEKTVGEYPSWNMTVKFKEKESQKTREMKGLFLCSTPDYNLVKGWRGPVLYTKWFCESCPKEGRYYQRYLDHRPSGLEATGAFVHNGTTYPAILENRKGLLLRIFITDRGLWWTSQNYFSSSAVLK